MFNPKTSGIIAIAAFLLSFFIGLASRTAMPMLIVRAVLFAVLFFVITALIHFMVSRFLPELLAGDSHAEEVDFMPGSRINIMEGDTGGGQSAEPSPGGLSFMGAQAEDSEDGLGHISDLPSKEPADPLTAAAGIQGIGLVGMDQNAQDGYNGEGKLEELPEPGVFAPWDPAAFSGSASSEPGAFVPDRPPVSGGGKPPASGKLQDANFAEVSDSGDFFPDLDSMAGAFMPSSAAEGSDAGEYTAAASSKRPRSNKNSGWSGDFSAKDMAMGLRTALNKEKEG